MAIKTEEKVGSPEKGAAIQNLSIFGLGYVGCVSAACLAKNGLNVIGLDVNLKKSRRLAEGLSPIFEPELDSYLKDAVDSKRLVTVENVSAAVEGSDACFICVGTPSLEAGSLNMEYVLKVTEEIGTVLKDLQKPFILIYRSTLQPGTTETKIIPLLRSFVGERLGRDIHVVVLPEFLREGTAIRDFFSPGKTVIGSEKKDVAEKVAAIFRGKTGPLFVTDPKVAEVIKIVNNVFHALKVGFGNEVGTFCNSLGIDAHKLMDIFLADTQLNISPKYLKPGKPFGGSCLPKDLRAMKRVSVDKNLQLPIINSIMESNKNRIDDILKRIMKREKAPIGFLGMSFKENTDDLRESPTVDLIEYLLGKGYKLKIYDPQITYSYLTGSNKEYLDKHIPHITELLAHDLKEVVDASECLVVSNDHPDFHTVPNLLTKSIQVFDLVGLKELQGQPKIAYEGLYW